MYGVDGHVVECEWQGAALDWCQIETVTVSACDSANMPSNNHFVGAEKGQALL